MISFSGKESRLLILLHGKCHIVLWEKIFSTSARALQLLQGQQNHTFVLFDMYTGKRPGLSTSTLRIYMDKEKSTPTPRTSRNDASSSHIARISKPLTGISTPKHILNTHRRTQRRRKICPHPCRSVARTSILRKRNLVRPGLRATPRALPNRIENTAHSRILEHDAGVVAPRPTEIVRFRRNGDAVLRGDRAGVEDVPGRIGRRAPAIGCDRAGGNGADVDLLEPGGGFFAVDEIGGADDEGLGVELVAGVGEESVLVADQLVGFVALVFGVCGYGEVLAI